MGFQHGLSGLNTASTNLDVIGNNIANANTAGFKLSQAQFTDVYANALGGGSSANQVGIGSKIADISQQFSQGNISSTSNPLDIAINGAGFFRMDNGWISGESYGLRSPMDKKKPVQWPFDLPRLKFRTTDMS